MPKGLSYECLLRRLQSGTGLYFLGAGSSAGIAPQGRSFWTAAPLDFLRNLSGFSPEIPVHSALTQQIINRWLHNRGYYLLENFDERTDNPDQRIQEDVGSLINYSIELSMGLIAAVATFIAFIYVLWSLSGTLTVPMGRFGTFRRNAGKCENL